MSFYTTPPIPLVLDTDTPPPLETPLTSTTTSTPRKKQATTATTIPFPLKTPPYLLHRQQPRLTAKAAAAAACRQYYTKKYQVRNCPPHVASECKGFIKLGNDGKQYFET